MAHITKRTTAESEARYDVGWRLPGGKPHKKPFKRRAAADRFRRKIEGDEIIGVFTDYRGADTVFGPYATDWLTTRLVRGRPLSLSTVQGYTGMLRRNIDPTSSRMPGLTTKELMARIGHASPQAALRYQHATAERDERVAEFLEAEIRRTDA